MHYCMVPDCEHKVDSRQLCATHYSQWKRGTLKVNARTRAEIAETFKPFCECEEPTLESIAPFAGHQCTKCWKPPKKELMRN